MNRKQALLNWAQTILCDNDCTIEPASSDASFRSYWRVFSKNSTYVIMDAPPEHEDCLPFIDISQRLLDSKVNAPAILGKDLQQGFLLLTDLGSTQYLDILDQKNFNTLYQEALDSLHNIQLNSSQKNLRHYDKALLTLEMKLFDDWFIEKHLGIDLSNEQKTIIYNCQEILIINAIEQPQSFVHRDYHSRNLMHIKSNNPGILDFQDAVIGPVTYDLVSLLKDCYIKWDESDVNNLSNTFRQKFNQQNAMQISKQQWQKWFDLMGMQRHLKAIGIFCRLNYRDNKPNYLKDIALTLNYIEEVCLKYSELKSFSNLLKSITPSVDKLCAQ